MPFYLQIKRELQLFHTKGLTYGSFVLQEKAKLLYAFEAFKATLEFLYAEGIKSLDIRVIPTFYNTLPADELEYFLFKCDATLLKRDASMVIDYAHTINFIKSRRQCIKRAAKNGLTIKKENKFDVFWNKLLIPNMSRRYDVDPVHSLEEIELLASSFPENIQQFNVYKGEDLVAGTTVFLTKTTIHPQYIAANTDKNALESIDFLYNYLINDCNDTKRYFDFSTSSEENGTILNKGILFWKESYGARTYTTDNYLVETKSYKNLNLNLK